MSLFIETICLENGKFRNLTGHNRRLNHTRKAIFGMVEELDLNMILSSENYPEGKFKTKVIYDTEIRQIEILPYEEKKISSFELIECDIVEYSFKSADRTIFEELKSGSRAEDIIIVKDGFITDSSYANLIFWDGKNWITPSRYLLNGTMRQHLLRMKRIYPKDIKPSDLKNFTHFKLINAMLDWEESFRYTIDMIKQQ